MPNGAVLSAGSDQGNGIWTLTPAQLPGLKITPPANSGNDFQLTVTAEAKEVTGDVATTSATMNVQVTADADAPTLSTQAASGTEDTAIALDITSGLVDTDGSESLSIVVSGVPNGAVLSAGSDQGDGTWTLTPAQLPGLTIAPPADSGDDFQLTVTATSKEAEGDTASTSATVNVTVTADADAPTLSTQAASGLEDTAIALNVSSGLTDTDGSESLSIVIAGVPTGATLSAGRTTATAPGRSHRRSCRA